MPDVKTRPVHAHVRINTTINLATVAHATPQGSQTVKIGKAKR